MTIFITSKTIANLTWHVLPCVGQYSWQTHDCEIGIIMMNKTPHPTVHASGVWTPFPGSRVRGPAPLNVCFSLHNF
jgi:hypothetical protein